MGLTLLVLATANAACAALPADITLANQTYTLPDPFTFLNGTAVATADAWSCRRAQIRSLFERFELGDKPPRPPVLSSSFDNATSILRITAGLDGTNTVSWNVNVSYPNTTTANSGPIPALITYGGLSLPRPDGAALLILNNSEIAEQTNPSSSRGKGLFYNLYGSNATAGALTAWAWATSRIIDVLSANQTQLRIDATRVAVTGCSRNGKGAMVAGALDDRIALTLPQESGSGGDACWRISRDMLVNENQLTQTAQEIVRENVWFAPAFDAFGADNYTVGTLPVDHHQLAGLIAPRGLYSTSNTDFLWLGDESSFDCMVSANKIFSSLGVGDRHGFSQVGGHAHCTFPDNQVPELQAFYQRFLFGNQAANTNIVRTTGNWTFNSTWAPWSVPTLVQAGGRTPTTVNEGASNARGGVFVAAVIASVAGSLLWV